MFYLYLNLAFADVFMGIYLITIASVDLATINRYSEFAVNWQTGHGCQFAGFCAILSSVMSIYILLVITIERVYTIRYAMEARQLKKMHAVVIMAIGWFGGIIIAALPLFGVSNYGRVSICLPFDTRTTVGLVYVAFILIFTGLCSFVILGSYIYLFYIVSRKKRMYRSLTGKEELILAFRMGLLVFTDFACWFPIAFFGLTAAFGNPLIGVEDSKFLLVFIFPINSCLNPILYSFSTKTFRYNLCGLLGKCGLFKSYNNRLRARRSSGAVLNSTTNRGSSNTDRRGSLMTRLLSLSSYTNSRRGSAMSGNSGSSLEDSATIPNPYYLPNLPNYHRPSIVSTDSNVSSEDDEERVSMSYLRQPRASQSSLMGVGYVQGLQAVPEEIEFETHSPHSQGEDDSEQTRTETSLTHRCSADSTGTNSMELKYNKVYEDDETDSQGDQTETRPTIIPSDRNIDQCEMFRNSAPFSPSYTTRRKYFDQDEVYPESTSIPPVTDFPPEDDNLTQTSTESFSITFIS